MARKLITRRLGPRILHLLEDEHHYLRHLLGTGVLVVSVTAELDVIIVIVNKIVTVVKVSLPLSCIFATWGNRITTTKLKP